MFTKRTSFDRLVEGLFDFDDLFAPRRGGGFRSYTEGADLHVEVPGVKAGQLDLGIDGNQLRLRYDGGKLGTTQTWELSPTVDRDGIRAKLADGLLVVSLPKRAATAAGRKIDIAPG